MADVFACFLLGYNVSGERLAGVELLCENFEDIGTFVFENDGGAFDLVFIACKSAREER